MNLFERWLLNKYSNQYFTSLFFSEEIKKVWEDRKTISSNLRDIGLGWDPNKIIKIPNAREERAKLMKKMHGFVEEDNTNEAEPKLVKRPKGFVMEEMEADANALRESNFRFVRNKKNLSIDIDRSNIFQLYFVHVVLYFRLPKGVVAHLSYMMDKYKLNYKAMVMDKKNYDQWTWKQFRAKCRRFMSIPEQFDVYLQSRNLDNETLDWNEYESDSEI